jgi:apolipoprotein N-acyltransferase
MSRAEPITKRLSFVLSAVLLALASFLPETAWSLLCALGFAVALAFGAKRSQTLLRDFYLTGLLFSALSFYWLPSTLSLFGGFGYLVALSLFLLFCLVSALQFVVCAWLYKQLRKSPLESYCLALPLSWLVSEVVCPRLFPWALGHLLVAWTTIAGLAEYVGVFPLSALAVWWAEFVLSVVLSWRVKKHCFLKMQAAVVLLTFVLFVIGSLRVQSVKQELKTAPTVKAALVQGNVSVEQKGDIRLLNVNVARYGELSEEATAKGAEVLFWPESVLNIWTPEKLENVRDTKFDPFPQASVPLMYGGLSFRRQPKSKNSEFDSEKAADDDQVKVEPEEILGFNTAFGIDETGRVLGRYHKRVLMPFGEYLPFESVFPWLRKISPYSGDLTPGDKKAPLVFNIKGSEAASPPKEVAAAGLICYEDLVPRLSSEASLLGANVLVNLTNDAWYGNTSAPYQHHLLAQWRAIETRRFLLRVTNTGYTAVVNPFGRTVQGLPLFTEGYLLADFSLLKGRTLYALIGDKPVWLVVLAVLAYLACLSCRRRKNK